MKQRIIDHCAERVIAARPELLEHPEGTYVRVPSEIWDCADTLARWVPMMQDAVDIARESRDAAESAAKAAVQAEMAALRAENARLKNKVAYYEGEASSVGEW